MNTRNLLRRCGAFVVAALLFSGTFFAAGTKTVEAQGHRGRRVVVVPYRVYNPYWGWGGYYRPYRRPFGWYDPYYSQYVFSNSETAASQGYKDGYKTGADDGKKHKSFDPERSHYYHDAGFGNFAEVYRSAFSRGYDEGYRRRVG